MESATLVPGNSLITATPDEGRHLAVKLARLTVKLTQPDDARRAALREVYANDADMLIRLYIEIRFPAAIVKGFQFSLDHAKAVAPHPQQETLLPFGADIHAGIEECS